MKTVKFWILRKLSKLFLAIGSWSDRMYNRTNWCENCDEAKWYSKGCIKY